MTAPDRRDVSDQDPPPPEPTQLLDELAAGDAAAFEWLFNTYFSPLRRFVCGYLRSWTEAEDVVHDLFLQLWRRRAWLGSVRDLDAYLYHIARNQALNHLKHQRVEDRWRTRRAAAPPDEPAHAPPAAELDLISSERTAALVRAVDALPPRQREVILLRWRDQASLEEIAAKLGISTNTVEIHITRAHKQLRKALPHLLD